jgi:hypothetical protein
MRACGERFLAQHKRDRHAGEAIGRLDRDNGQADEQRPGFEAALSHRKWKGPMAYTAKVRKTPS